jgi:hypothetical protein
MALAGLLLQPAFGLELILQADAVKPGAPITFSVVLVNRSEHAVHIPMPTKNCEDGYNGSVQVLHSYKPFRGNSPLQPGAGCVLDRGGPWPSILERIQGSVALHEPGWKILNAGQSFKLTDPGWIVFRNGAPAGTYEFWAVYAPPSTLASDRATLAAERLDIPTGELSSNHLIPVKKK